MHATRFAKLFVVGIAFSSGCTTTPGARSSIWPTKKPNDPIAIGSSATSLPTTDSMTGKLSSTAKGVKGQFASVGTAVSSAYGKAKTAVSSAFTPATNSSGPVDATTLATNPTNASNLGPEMHVITGQMYESNGNYAKAMDFYSKALEAETTNIAALTSMARLHERQNNAPKASEFYQKAIAAAPQQASLYAELGGVQSRMGQTATAKEQYQKAINIDPTNRAYRSSVAGLLIDEGQAEQAEQELRQVDPPAMAQYQMAYLYMSRQNLASARQHLTNALTIDPNLKPARDMMNTLSSSGVVQQASGLAQQANQIYQQSGQVMQQANQLLGTTPQAIPQTAAIPTNTVTR